MRIRMVQQIAATCFDQMTSHFDVVMCEIQEELLETLERI